GAAERHLQEAVMTAPRVPRTGHPRFMAGSRHPLQRSEQMSIPVVDADGHVTESNEQVAKYLDEPYRRRPLTFPLYPQDGWDRRLLGTLGSVGGTAEQWLKALDAGGMETTVLYPTLGLFLSFLKDRAWAVAICRAYNTFLHEEFIKKSPRLQAVALLPIQDPDAAAAEPERAVGRLPLGGPMLAPAGTHGLGATRFPPHYDRPRGRT